MFAAFLITANGSTGHNQPVADAVHVIDHTECPPNDTECLEAMSECGHLDIECQLEAVQSTKLREEHPKEKRLMRISGYFAAFGLVLMLVLGENASYTSSDKNRSMHNRMVAWMLTALGVTMMWGFWACVYMAQMYPLFLPEIEVSGHHWTSNTLA